MIGVFAALECLLQTRPSRNTPTGGDLATAGVIQRRQLVGELREIDEVRLADRLDLPLHEMQAAISARIATVALDAAVLRVDVELDSPLDLGYSKIDVHGAS